MTTLGHHKNISQILATLQKVCQGHTTAPLHEPEITELDKEYVMDCLDSGWVSSVGKYVDRFEQQLADFTQSQFAVATVNGTAALHSCLLLAGVSHEHEVLLPTLTFVATANAVCYINAIPHFIDISDRTLGVDPKKLADYLQNIGEMKGNELYNKTTGRKISALIVMHSFGHPAQMEPLVKLCQQYHIKLIEDAAEALGSYYQEKHMGNFGHMAALSFNGNKILTTGGGGAILTNDPVLAQRAKHLTTTAKIPGTIASEHDELGYNYRLPNLNAAMGVAQLSVLSHQLTKKRRLAHHYQQLFTNIDGVSIFSEPENCRSNYWLNLLVLDQPNLSFRNELINICHKNGILVRPIWGLMHRQKYLSQFPQMPDLSRAECWFERVICLPSSPNLGNDL